MASRKMLANAIRALAMDAVQKANSGHPGAPMGMADIAEVLYNDFMRHNPANPEWSDRDRFVDGDGAARDPFGEVFALHQFHDEECDLGRGGVSGTEPRG